MDVTIPPAPDAFGNADFLTVELDPQQAITGLDTVVALPDGRSITVRLPAGVPHGMVLRLTAPESAPDARDIFLQVVLTSPAPPAPTTPDEPPTEAPVERAIETPIGTPVEPLAAPAETAGQAGVVEATPPAPVAETPEPTISEAASSDPAQAQAQAQAPAPAESAVDAVPGAPVTATVVDATDAPVAPAPEARVEAAVEGAAEAAVEPAVEPAGATAVDPAVERTPMSAPPYPYGPLPFPVPPPPSRRFAGWQIAASAAAVLILAAGGGAATAVVRFVSERSTQPSAAGPTPSPTPTPEPPMTATAYQAMLTDIDTSVAKGVTELAQARTPNAIDQAGLAIATAADKGETTLRAAKPSKNLVAATEALADALHDLADLGAQMNNAAKSRQICSASSAMPKFSGSAVMASLRNAVGALATADSGQPYTMGAWIPPLSEQQTRQPGNGTYLKNGARSGSGHIKLDNKENGSDAVVGIATAGADSLLFSVYVRAGATFTVTGVKNGKYDIYVTMGTDWDPEVGAFSRDCNFNKFDEPIEFTNSSRSYTVWSITLQYVAGGTLTVEPDMFPR